MLDSQRSGSPKGEEPSVIAQILREHSAMTEAFVQFLWQEQCFDQQELRTLDGRPVRILKPGYLNVNAGPDFTQAEIILDGELLRGSVELHLNVSDWWAHGHQTDPSYTSVILHISLWDDSRHLQTIAGEKRIPTLALASYLAAPLDELLGWWREDRQEFCPLSTMSLASEAVVDVLHRLGQERFLEKVEYFSFHVERSDMEQMCYEGILDALGYSANREPFLELGKRLRLEYLLGKPRPVIEALLFGTAGLLPAQTGEQPADEGREYAEQLAEIWYSLGDAPTPLHASEWQFARLRPANFPTRRLAGMAGILDGCAGGSLILGFLSVVETVRDTEPLRSVFVRLCQLLMPEARGFWVNHSQFSGKSHRPLVHLIGQGRASDIIVNIVLPLLGLWASVAQSQSLSRAVQQLYDGHPALQPNHITRQLRQWLHVPRKYHSAKTQQGMIYLHHLFCSTGLCGVCPMAISFSHSN